MPMANQLAAFWSLSATALLRELQTSAAGLTNAQAQERLARYGLNRLKAKSRTGLLTLFLGQFKSPVILILLFAVALSLFLRDASDASIIIAIVFVSGVLGFWQERSHAASMSLGAGAFALWRLPIVISGQRRGLQRATKPIWYF